MLQIDAAKMGVLNMQFDVEYTDTFGGEANYSWVKRWAFEAEPNAPDAELKRKAKRVSDMTGVRGSWQTIGEMLEFRPSGSCTVLFVTWRD